MSFSSEQKISIINQIYKSQCCRRALLSGVLFARGALCDRGIYISVEKSDTAEFLSRLIKEFYSTEPEIARSEKGGRCIYVIFKSPSARKYVLEIPQSKNLFVPKCSFCQQSFLKGVFLASARVSDPKVQYSLEFSLGDRSQIFYDMLVSMGSSPKMADRRGGSSVYFRNSSEIEDFYGYAGMNFAMFATIEAKFNGEARRNIMRVTNCVTNNIQKTVDAAGKQLEIIRSLDEANLLSSLPEELEETARFRLQNPDLSLSQLAAISVPKLSKPGLSHRLKKIMEIGRSLLHEESE